MQLVPDIYWQWWVLGVSLLIIEVLTPTLFFMWIGFAALVTGIIALVAPSLTMEVQGTIFAFLSVISAFVGRHYVKKHEQKSDHPELNKRGEQYIGQVFEVKTEIKDGVGKVKIGDSEWRAAGENVPAGSKVKVVGVDGATLKVEPMEH